MFSKYEISFTILDYYNQSIFFHASQYQFRLGSALTKYKM
jgi:hypothetical protein